ncbi:MAG: ABC transporter substrate-binding protein [Woeseiaceae bacterium]|nr:ABC transporter substrate-binding protein [Woeseiaceae bacterium]
MFRLIRQASFLLAAAVMADCAAAAGAPGPLRIAASHWVADAPTKVADALDYFNRGAARPEIRITSYDSGKVALDSMLAGEADIALAASTPVAGALLDWWSSPGHEALPPLLVLASVSLSNQTHVVVANAAAGIESPADIAGQRVAVTLGTSGHFGWTEFARFHGIGDDAVTLVDLPVSRHEEYLRGGGAFAAVLWEPWASQLVTSLGPRARVFGTRHLYAVNWLLVTRPEVLTEYPGLDVRVLTAYRDSIALIDGDPERANELHAASSGVDADILRTTVAGNIYRLGIDWAMVADLETQLRWLAGRRGLTEGSIPGPYRYLYAAPLKHIESQRVTLPGYFFFDDLPPVDQSP